jgi:outer membrane protein TolC
VKNNRSGRGERLVGIALCLPVIALGSLFGGDLLLPKASFAGQPSESGSSMPAELLEAHTLLRGAQRMTLAEAMRASLLHNPSLQASFATIQASEWNLIANQRRWLPTASVQASPGTTLLGQVFDTTAASYPNNSNSSFATSTYNSSYNNFSNYSNASLGLILSWSFFDPSRQPAINTASSTLKAQKLAFNVVARSQVLNVETLYHRLQATQTLIGIYEQIYRQNQRQLQLVNAQLKIGMTNIGDAEQKKTQLLNQLNQLILLYRQQARDASDLAAVVGAEPGSSVVPSEPLEDPQGWPLSLEATVQEGLRLREEIQASLAEASAATWDARRLVNTYLPVLMLTGTAYGYRGQGTFSANVGQDPSPYFSRQYAADASVGLGLRWDFLDGGIRSAQAKQADFQARALQSQAQQNRLTVGDQIRSSYATYITAKLGLEPARLAYASSEKALQVATKRYEIGIGTMTDLIQATTQMGDAATNLSAMRLSYSNAIAELYRYSALWPSANRTEILREIQALQHKKP